MESALLHRSHRLVQQLPSLVRRVRRLLERQAKLRQLAPKIVERRFHRAPDVTSPFAEEHVADHGADGSADNDGRHSL